MSLLLCWMLSWALAVGPAEGADEVAALAGGTVVSVEAREVRIRMPDALVGLRPARGPRDDRTMCEERGTRVVRHGAEPATPAVQAVCGALRTVTLDWPTATAAPPARTTPRLQGLHGVVLAWWLWLAWALPRARWAWGWAALAGVVRVALPGPAVLMGQDYAVVQLVAATGRRAHNPFYGGAWEAFMGPWAWLVGSADVAVACASLVASCVTVAFVFELVAREVGDRHGHVAAAMLAVHPVAVATAGTETAFPLAAALGVGMVCAAGRQGTPAAVWAALSAVLLTHLRPLQVFVALVGVGLLVRRRAWAATCVALAGIAARAWELLVVFEPQQGMTDFTPGAYVEGLGRVLTPAGGLLVFDPWRSPVWLVPLALLGAWVGWRRWRRLTVVALVLLVVTALPTFHLHRLTDVVRFQLPAITWWVVLASMAVPARVFERATWAVATAGVLALGVARAHAPLSPRATWMVEHAHLRHARDTAPAGSVTWYDPTWDRFGTGAVWLADGPGAWRAATAGATPAEGDRLWVGRGDRLSGARWAGGCSTEVLWADQTPAVGLGVEDLAGPPVRLALERVAGPCGPRQTARTPGGAW